MNPRRASAGSSPCGDYATGPLALGPIAASFLHLPSLAPYIIVSIGALSSETARFL